MKIIQSCIVALLVTVSALSAFGQVSTDGTSVSVNGQLPSTFFGLTTGDLDQFNIGGTSNQVFKADGSGSGFWADEAGATLGLSEVLAVGNTMDDDIIVSGVRALYGVDTNSAIILSSTSSADNRIVLEGPGSGNGHMTITGSTNPNGNIRVFTKGGKAGLTFSINYDDTFHFYDNYLYDAVIGTGWTQAVAMVSNWDITGDYRTNGVALDFVSLARLVLATNEIQTLVSTKQPLATSLIYGGEVSTNIVPTAFNIAAGRAVFVDNYTNPTNPVTIFVDWTNQTGLVSGFSSSALIEYVSVSNDGSFVYTTVAPVERDRRSLVMLGVLVHDTPPFNVNRIAVTAPLWSQDGLLGFFDAINTLGPTLHISGNQYVTNGPNRAINKTAGKAYGVGYNYDGDKQSPNIKALGALTAITFPILWRDSPFSSAVITNQLPSDQYDPNGDGTLVNLPSGCWTIHRLYLDPATEETIAQYGQNSYDSLKKAAESFNKEQHVKVPEVDNLLCRSCVVVASGATNFQDQTRVKFIDLGVVGDNNFASIPTWSRFAESVELVDALSYQRQEITLIFTNGFIYADVEQLGGGDLTYAFEQREYILDCTTGSGVGGAARIALTPGTASNPQKGWVTVIRSNDVAILQNSAARPTGEFAYVYDYILPDTNTFVALGRPYGSQRHSDAKSWDGRGAVARNSGRLRLLHAQYESGIAQTVTITANGGAVDDVEFVSTAGEVSQLNIQDFPEWSIITNGIMVVNHPATNYLVVTNLSALLVDANNVSLSGRRFNFVIWGAINKATSECQMYLNLPLGSYGSDSEAVADPDGSSVTSIPKDFRGKGFLIARVSLRHTVVSGGTWSNLADSELGLQVIDLRDQIPGSFVSSASIPASSTFPSSAFSVFDGDKFLMFDISAYSAATTRTVSWPDRDFTVGAASDIASWEQHFMIQQQDMTNGFAFWAPNPIGRAGVITEIFPQMVGNVTGLVSIITRPRTDPWNTYTVVGTNLPISGTGGATVTAYPMTNNVYVGCIFSALSSFDPTNRALVEFEFIGN